jgi:hypothetical protein
MKGKPFLNTDYCKKTQSEDIKSSEKGLNLFQAPTEKQRAGCSRDNYPAYSRILQPGDGCIPYEQIADRTTPDCGNKSKYQDSKKVKSLFHCGEGPGHRKAESAQDTYEIHK